MQRWAFLFLAVSLALTPAGADVPETVSIESTETDRVVLRYQRGAPVLSPTADGFVVDPRHDRRFPGRPGEPDLPYETFYVAVPFGADVRLDVEILDAVVTERVDRVRPFPRRRLTDEGRRTLERAQRALEAGEAPSGDPVERESIFDLDAAATVRTQAWPDRLAWLGEPAVMRDQRIVPIHVAAVRWTGAARRLDTARDLRLTVSFTGGQRAARSGRTPFDAAARGSIVNFEQGLNFRRPPADPTRERSRASSLRGPSPILRIKIRAEGIYRLDFSALDAEGFTALPISTWTLTHRGEGIGFHVVGDGDDTLEPGEEIRFYGSPLDDEEIPELHVDFTNIDDIYRDRDFGDENVYFLKIDGSAPVLPTVDATPDGLLTSPSAFLEVVRSEVDNVYFPFDNGDPWYSSPTLGLSQFAREDLIELTDLASSLTDVGVRVVLQGRSEDETVSPDHETTVLLKRSDGVVLATDTQQWDGFRLFTHDFTWTYPGSGLSMTSTARVEINVTDTSPVRNQAILDYIEVSYFRHLDAVNNELRFRWPEQTREIVVEGFTTSDVEVYEIQKTPGQPMRYRRMTGVQVDPRDAVFDVRFRMNDDPTVAAGVDREFIAVASGGVKTPPSFDLSADTESDLRDNAKQADYLVIAHPDVLDDSPAGVFDQWVAHRESPAGGNYSVERVWYDDVVDEFGDGLWGPDAIREFLRYVMSNEPGEGWAEPRPTHVLLIGDASYNYREREAAGTFVPTQMFFRFLDILSYYSSDTYLGAVVGSDLVPDLLIGRVTSQNTAQTDLVLQKVIDVETTTDQGTWRKHWLMVSDGDKFFTGEADEFEAINDAGLSTRTGPYTTRHLRYQDYRDMFPEDPDGAINLDIQRSVNGADGIADGVSVVQYIGHGSFELWSDDAIWDERPGSPNAGSEVLTNAPRYPGLYAHNCLTGAFHWCRNFCAPGSLSYNFGRGWLLRDGGGSSFSLAPTGLSFNNISSSVSVPLWQAINGPPKVRTIGEAHLAGILPNCLESPPIQDAVVGCEFYALQGDPATRLSLPDVDPAKNLSAVAGNAEVQLTWQASDTPGATYDVFRQRESGSPPPYTPVNLTRLGTTELSFLDDTAENTETYRYFVLAYDGDGFDSRWSNFNEDCDVSGPDCVKATPLNDVPPVTPSGFAVDDPGLGDLLRLSWILNPEPDIGSYTVRWGTTEGGPYPFSVTVNAAATTASAPGLTTEQMYYFVLEATNTSGFSSSPAGELSDFPVLAPQGLRPPNVISDLFVEKSGDDALVTWSPVQTDIYGKPLAPVSYEILRGLGQTRLTNDQLVVVDTCVAPCVSWTDTGAITNGTDAGYRVRALGADGQSSALGGQFPAGPDVSFVRSETPGMVRLVWDPVTSAVDGTDSLVVVYEIWESSVPFNRIDIEDNVGPTLLTTTANPFLEIPEPVADRYYSVLAIDVGGNRSPY